MRPYMRLQNLFVREIDTSLPRETVVSELQKYCSPAQGKVVVPVSDSTGDILGIAYLNFLSADDGAASSRWAVGGPGREQGPACQLPGLPRLSVCVFAGSEHSAQQRAPHNTQSVACDVI